MKPKYFNLLSLRLQPLISPFLWLFVIFFDSSTLMASVPFEQMQGFTGKVLEATNLENGNKSYVLLNEVNGRIETTGNSYYPGLCFDKNQTCETLTTSKNSMIDSMRFLGRGNDYFDSKFNNFQDSPVTTHTKIEQISSPQIVINFYSSWISNKWQRISLRPVKEFTSYRLQTSKIEKDVSDRRDVGSVSQTEGKFRNSVFKINLPKSTGDQLETGGGSGTGFFISQSGLAMTNYHVISNAPECLRNFICNLAIGTTDIKGKIEYSTVKIHILAADRDYDIAILQIDIPRDFSFHEFQIEHGLIGPDLYTLGYPGDRDSLTYSYGKLVGFFNKTFGTSIYVSGGASGSPVLNSRTNMVVGVVSNGIGSEGEKGQGTPAIVRPMPSIITHFGIDDYITGNKEVKVKKLIESLQNMSTSSEVHNLLIKLKNENTYIGIKELSEAMIISPNIEIRKEIFNYLKSTGFIGIK